MQAILFALISFFGWGTGDIFGTIAIRRLGALSTQVWSYIFGLTLSSFYIPFAHREFFHFTPEIFIYTVFINIIAIIGTSFFYAGLRLGPAPLVGTIAPSYAPLVVIFSLLFFNEQVSQSQSVAILIVFTGLFLSILDFKKFKKEKNIISKGVLFGVVAMLLWAFYFTFIKISINYVGWFWPTYISFFLFPLPLLFMKLRNIKLEKPTFKKALFPLLAMVLLLRIAEYGYNIAISKGLISVVVPIVGSNTVLFVALAFLIFKDPITKQQVFGIITTLTGIVLLSFFSV